MDGVYLSYEGYEKVHEYLFEHEEKESKHESLSNDEVMTQEKENIKSTVTTDFVLSIEIVLIALSTVIDKPLIEQITITSMVAFAATVGVYGIVALVVRLDDLGVWFVKRGQRKVGIFLVGMMGVVIGALGYIGTIAMLLVAGGIFVHNIDFLHHIFESNLTFSGMAYTITIILEMSLSFIVGLLAFLVYMLYFKLTK